MQRPTLLHPFLLVRRIPETYTERATRSRALEMFRGASENRHDTKALIREKSFVDREKVSHCAKAARNWVQDHISTIFIWSGTGTGPDFEVECS